MKIINIGGGLGNQMFQYAFYLALKKKEKCILDISYFEFNNIHNGYELEEIFSIKEKKIKLFYKRNIILKIIWKLIRKILCILKYIYYEKRNLNVEENLEKIKKENPVFLSGTWCSENYFLGVTKDIKNIYKFPNFNDRRNKEIAEKIEKTNSVSIHIRRGDYLLKENREYSGLVDEKYYRKAIKIIKNKIEKPVFFIFSDDISWCQKNLKLENEEIYYIDWNKKQKSYKDMQLMSMCKHNIIPHSTFSWWAAWLNSNPDKVVVAPEVWFNKKYMDFEINTENLIPKEWIKIENYKN